MENKPQNKVTSLPNLTKEEWETKKALVINDDIECDSFISQGITVKDLENLLKDKSK